MKPNDFWPFARTVRCHECGGQCVSRDAVPVVDGATLVGLRHKDCT